MTDVTEDELAATPYARRVGERLRAIRRQKRLSLQDVEAASVQEFKASVLGAYERGERAISVPRLQRLARFYGVQYSTDPTSALLTLRMLYSTGFRDVLSKIQCPVLMTAGTMFLAPMSQFEEMAASIPNARFEPMATGHYAAVESPELVGPLAQKFLAELKR